MVLDKGTAAKLVAVVVAAIAVLSLTFEEPKNIGSVGGGNLGGSHKLCVVGGGIGGASAAHFLRQDFPNASIVLFEKSDEVGGRLHSFKYGGKTIEAGGAIIHDRNKYMRYFSTYLEKEDAKLSKRGWGIFDGQEFRIRTGRWKLITYFRMFWRYGLDLVRLSSSVSNLLSNFDKIYDLQGKGEVFNTPEELLKAVGELPIENERLAGRAGR